MLSYCLHSSYLFSPDFVYIQKQNHLQKKILHSCFSRGMGSHNNNGGWGGLVAPSIKSTVIASHFRLHPVYNATTQRGKPVLLPKKYIPGLRSGAGIKSYLMFTVIATSSPKIHTSRNVSTRLLYNKISMPNHIFSFNSKAGEEAYFLPEITCLFIVHLTLCPIPLLSSEKSFHKSSRKWKTILWDEFLRVI